MVECKACNGSGKCFRCNGQGFIIGNEKFMTWTEYVSCPSCGTGVLCGIKYPMKTLEINYTKIGNGICPACRGSGSIPKIRIPGI